MDVANDSRLIVPASLLWLERGQDEVCVIHPTVRQPLYFRTGKAYLRSFLDAVRDLPTLATVQSRFPEDGPLLNTLVAHGILAATSETNDPQCPINGKISCCNRCDGVKSNQRSAVSLYLLLAQSCNMACTYCLNGQKTYRKTRGQMSESVGLAAVDAFSDQINPGGKLDIVFFGGEPLLNWNLAKKIIRHCENDLRSRKSDQTFTYHLTSNLTTLPSDFIEWAKRFGITVLCNIDGPPSIHDKTRPYLNGRGTHADTARTVRQLRDAGIDVALRATVTSLNDDMIPEVSAHHKEIGGTSSAFVAVNPVTSDEDLLAPGMLPNPDRYVKGLLQLLRSDMWEAHRLFPYNGYAQRVKSLSAMSHGCGAPFGNTPVVDVTGNVFPCIYLVGLERFHLGNIVAKTYPRRDVLTNLHRVLDVSNIAECRSCSWRYYCGGGCPVGRLTVADNPAATPDVVRYTQDIACKTTRTMTEAALWRLADESVVRESHP